MKLAVVMDPIERIKPEKDGTLDLLLSAQSFGYELKFRLVCFISFSNRPLTLKKMNLFFYSAIQF